jgi:hypothetical protein
LNRGGQLEYCYYDVVEEKLFKGELLLNDLKIKRETEKICCEPDLKK